MSNFNEHERPTQRKVGLFKDDAPASKEYWWGMPECESADCRPVYRITVNFMTQADVKAFAEATGTTVTAQSDSCWFPHQPRLSGGEYYYAGKPTPSRYPVCIPSKGRAELQTTGKVLTQLGVDHKFFVEECDYAAYVKAVGKDHVVKLPFSNLGQGSIPARNFIWDWCAERGHKRHWTLDDNIRAFRRFHNNRRLSVKGGGFFQAMEDFVDRYENVAMAGPHHQGFVPDRVPNLAPALWNSRVYSCILLDTTLPDRWRGRYNEDTDLSLRLLKQGKSTLLFRALMMDKGGTYAGGGEKGKAGAMKGGNTDTVYTNGEDYRKAFAESLQKQHPDVVEVVWKFERWHHSVNYRPFEKNKPILKKGITPHQRMNEYGMELKRKKSGDAIELEIESVEESTEE